MQHSWSFTDFRKGRGFPQALPAIRPGVRAVLLNSAFVPLAAISAATALSLTGGQALAATYTVTQTTDDGSGTTPGSLSWAILNAVSDGDFIFISPGVSRITVTGGALPGLQASVTIAAEQAVEITGASLSSNTASSLELSGASLSQAVTTGLSGSILAAPGDPGSSTTGQDGGSGQNGATALSAQGSAVTSSAGLTGGDGGRGGQGADSSSANISFAGGTGGTGGTALDVSHSQITNTGTLTGGNGGLGGPGGDNTSNNRDGGFGGTGGTGGLGASGSHFTLTNTGTISGGGGGRSGIGGNGIYTHYDGTQTPNWSGFGAGGMGGTGVSGTDMTLMNSGTITGGSGFDGEVTVPSYVSNAYYVGNGGAAGAGIVSVDSTITNTGRISGGNGGASGYANTAFINPGVGGAAGTAGIGISGLSTTIVNSGTISGGVGGTRFSPTSLTVAGPAGAGGAGISGSNLTIVNSGTISGGLSGDGKTRANAIEFTSGSNSLELQAGSVITGNVVANGSSDTLILGGSGSVNSSSNFDLSSIGTQYTGFEAYSKSGTSYWMVTGATANGAPLSALSVSGGTLDFFGSSTSALVTTLSVDGGTLRISNGAALTNASGSTVIGKASGSNGTIIVAGSGSVWNVASGSSSSLSVGGQGTGVLTISDGGTVSAGGGSGLVQIGASGAVNIGAAAGETAKAPGTLSADIIFFNGANGVLVFNHTDMNYQFNVNAGSTGTMAFYSGVTTLTGDYSGFTGPQPLYGKGDYIAGNGIAEIYKTGALNLTSAYGGAVGLNKGVVFQATGTHDNYFLVRSGGTLGGSGTIGGVTVFSGGTMAPANATGTLSANNVEFQTGSTFQVELAAAGGSGKLVSIGIVNIDDGAKLSILSDTASTYSTAISYSILEAQAFLVGTFQSVTDNFVFLDPAVEYATQGVTLTLTRATTPDGVLLSFASRASGPNGKSAADAIDAAGAGALHDAVLSMREGEPEQAFQMLSGEAHATVQRTVMSASSTSRTSMTQRIITATGGVGGSTGTQVSMAFNGKGGVPLARQIDARVWSQATGGWGRTDATASTAAAESYGGGFLTGLDAEILPGWRTGLMAGYSRNQFSSAANSASGSADTYQAGVYAGTQMDAIGLRLGASYAWHTLDTRRNVAFTGFADRLAAAYSASTAQAFAEIGYALHLTPATVEPFAGIAVINQHTDGFTETGGPAALNSRSSNDVLGVTTLGLRGEAAIGRISGFTASLTGTLAWRHAFGDVTPSSTLRFANGGDAFTVSGTPLDRDAALFEAGLSLKNDQALGLTLAYQGELGTTTQTHAGRLSLQYRF
ncbi:Extracellular serine protease precursor [Pannonibacter phragmitetus]|uniref:Extracellular serine protease n=1 Tax=Pannonibacter phragmitetus TaxID=121719 RepID=A0A378ZUX2_9HYPH|nr:autotransporter domain-containing protein [Pannonibacter phragmitetus]SUB00813.1 Extracellular serine protease precursor [Pannonibacter phragmitetus]